MKATKRIEVVRGERKSCKISIYSSYLVIKFKYKLYFVIIYFLFFRYIIYLFIFLLRDLVPLFLSIYRFGLLPYI